MIIERLSQEHRNIEKLLAILEALEPQDWTEIASALTNPEDPLFSEAAEETFDALRARILQLEQKAEAERH